MKSEKLRIAQVAPLWTPIPPRTYGGIELLMKLHIDELVARGHDVTLFSSADCKTAGRLHEVVEMNLTDLVTEGKAFMFEYYANSMMAEVLRVQDEFDILHFHLSAAWLPLAATARTPALFTMHTCVHLDDEWVMRRWPRVAVNGISRCQMHGVGLKLGREFPIVYNGCDFAAYEPSFEPGKYLAFLGRLSPGKNPLDAIRIAQAVGMPILLAGRPQNGDEERYFAEKIAPLIDDDRVRWIGPVNHAQKNELLRHAAALLFPIQWEEPFGLVMIEAMACGTPVVAHRRGSVEEVVENGLTGYHASVIDGLAELVPSALELDRRKIRAHAESRFGFQQMVDDYLALYRSVVAEWKEGQVRPRKPASRRSTVRRGSQSDRP
jgi:glycosyltransferase involved in cell wall biosynthesis